MLVPITLEQAQVANYFCAAITAVILCLRLATSRFQPKVFDAAFFLTLFTILILAGRTVCVYYTLTFETGNDAVLAAASGKPFSDAQLSMIKAGTIYSIVKRFLETTFWWTQASVLLLFYRRLVIHLTWPRHGITAIWVFMGVSYIATIFVIFFECSPFERYWQISPDPGVCVRAYNTTLLQCVTNIIIDIALMVVAIPIVLVKARHISQRIKIGFLIALGIFLAIVTSVRLVYIYADGSLQPTRSFWASVQIMFTAFVANVPLIYGSLKLWRDKSKSSASRSGSRPNRSTLNLASKDETFVETLKADIGITRTVMVKYDEENFGDLETTRNSSVF